MTFLKTGWCIGIAAVLAFGSTFAQIAPAEQLLPDDTIGLVTIPDWKKFTADLSQTAFGQLWNDPAMKPFRDNFTSNFQADFLKPLEKELGVKLAEYQELLQGQITLALTVPREGTTEMLDVLLLIDSKDKSQVLTTKLNELKKKWTDAGKTVQTEKIRDTEFSSIGFTGKDVDALLKKAFPAKEDEEAEEDKSEDKKEEKIQLRIGQYKSLLIIGENSKAIEKLLARQSGGLVPPLAEKAAYQKAHTQLFRDSLAHGWVNVKPLFEKLLQFAQQEKQQQPNGGMPSMSMDKILPALGFGSIESLAGKMGGGAEGSTVEFLIGAPEGQREGLVKLFALEKKEAAPPAFVPADVTKFTRTRIDAQKTWTALENLLNKIDPSVAGFVQLMLSSAGKDKDPNFDLKKNLIGNLGDDFIQFEKAPKSAKPEDLQNAPSLTLIGSPNPAQLLDALRMITSLMPPPISSAPLKEREYLGKKIYSMSLGAMPEMEEDEEPAEPGKPPRKKEEKPAPPKGQTFSFASSGGYVAFSTDEGMLEDYLRSGENPPKALRGTPGFAEAAQKVGGMENGFFSYENQAEAFRLAFEALKTDPETLDSRLYSLAAAGLGDGEDSAFGRMFNLKLLPSFDRISKYFGIAVGSASTTPEGFLIKVATPKPAGLK
jgi:hypothetical protein